MISNIPSFIYNSSWKKNGDILVGTVFLSTPWSLNDVQLDPTKGIHPRNVIDFVWETTCEKSLRVQHSLATVVNKLHNSRILESKSDLAFLQVIMKDNSQRTGTKVDLLDTVIAQSSEEVLLWCRTIWATETMDGGVHQSFSNSWWAVKASQGNGGRDVWIVNKENYEQVVSTLPKSEEYVIQRY
jgi:hypothetical protein